jgi:hypothetical protein
MPPKPSVQLKGDEGVDAEEFLDLDNSDEGPPLHWRKPRIHPEIVNHGAAIARLAVELARLDRVTKRTDGKPVSSFLVEANELLNGACELVPSVTPLGSEDINPREVDAWVRRRIEKTCKRPVVPWEDICAEGEQAKNAPTRKVEMLRDGKPFTYTWKAYVQIEKEEGLRALLLRHAERIVFGDESARKHLKKIKLALWRLAHFKARLTWPIRKRKKWLKKRAKRAARSRKRLNVTNLLRESRWHWTRGLMLEALKAAPRNLNDARRTWLLDVVDRWRTASCRDFAGRLLAEAKAGLMREVDFNAIAFTRQLNPRGGSQRNSDVKPRTSDQEKGET